MIFISLSFSKNDNQKRVFIVDFFCPFSNDCSLLRSHFGANIVLDITVISNYVRYKERQFCSANMHRLMGNARSQKSVSRNGKETRKHEKTLLFKEVF